MTLEALGRKYRPSAMMAVQHLISLNMIGGNLTVFDQWQVENQA